jgi:peptide-methionine (S)-S-oxide reductase
METIYFGAGCFWGVEFTFQNLAGVKSTSVGFMGGDSPANYEQVCNKDTGHAEVVEVEYDPKQINLSQLLEIFWNSHNPTTLNRQGPDVGHQYRSVIFYTNEKQEEISKKSLKVIDESGRFKNPIVTEIVAVKPYYKADEHHQDYLKKRGKTTCGI